ncbi:MAG: hypothetical protein FWG08_06820 [Propionibacteriaceae bacterium]|nr:hypothetical protein [Propionibacteriaceae bacterium]
MADEKKSTSASNKPKTTQRKVVSASPTTGAKTAQANKPVRGEGSKASPEAKKKAFMYRIFAGILWALAIGLEMFAIFYLLKRTEMNNFMVWLIGAIVVIGILAIIGSQLWKKANHFDPASEKDTVRFFVQNQLGVIITIIAFLPLIILIFMNDNMKGSQKAIAGTIGIIVMALTGLASVDWDPMSEEKMDEQDRVVWSYSQDGYVYWVDKGSVYHLCAYKDNNPQNGTRDAGENEIIAAFSRGDSDIKTGSLKEAHDAGKHRLSMYGLSECDYTEDNPVFPNCAAGGMAGCQ